MKKINPISSTYEGRPKSNVVKWLMQVSGRSTIDIAAVLNVSVEYFNNKLHRDCFSIEDICTVANECGYALALVDDLNEAYRIDISKETTSAEQNETKKRLLGARIAATREAFGWSQIELAAKLGITSAAVSAWELGYRGVSPKHLKHLCRAFQLSAKQLMGDEPITENDACMKALRERTQSISQKLQCT